MMGPSTASLKDRPFTSRSTKRNKLIVEKICSAVGEFMTNSKSISANKNQSESLGRHNHFLFPFREPRYNHFLFPRSFLRTERDSFQAWFVAAALNYTGCDNIFALEWVCSQKCKLWCTEEPPFVIITCLVLKADNDDPKTVLLNCQCQRSSM